MTYEEILDARRRHPFRPFFIKTLDGRVFFVREETHLAVAPHVVACYDELRDVREMLKPSEIDGLI